MSKENKINESDHQDIIDMYLQGKSGIKIAEKYDVTNSKIYYLLNKLGVKRRSNKINSRKYYYNKEYFKEINTPEKAYWLGFIYADGYVRRNSPNNKNGANKCFGLALSIKDKEHLIKFKDCIDATYEIKEYEQNSEVSFGSRNYCRIQIFGDSIFDQLKSHGVLENKTFKLKAPKLSNELTSHFIRGYMDGDGCISKYYVHYSNKSSLIFKIKINGTKNLLDYIKAYIEDKEVANINKYYNEKNSKIRILEFGGNCQVRNFLDLVYNNANIYLNRKYKRYKELCNEMSS